jgi:hypothetical protein
MNANKLNGQDELVWRTCSMCNGLHHERTCYKNYLQTWEEMEDGKIQGQMCGQEILIDNVLIF